MLRTVADGIGLKGEDIVPPDEEIKAQMQQGAATGSARRAWRLRRPAGAPGAPPGAPQAPQTNVVGPTPGAGPGTAVNPAQGPA